MAPLQQLERSIVSGASSGANEHADGARRTAAHGQPICADPLFPLADTTGTTPRSNMSRRHYGCPLSRTPRADDGRPVPAGLLARDSCTSPPPSRRLLGSGMRRRRSPLTVAGAAAALRLRRLGLASHRVPFSPAAAKEGVSGTVTRLERSSAGAELSTRRRARVRSSRLPMARRPRRAGVRPSGSDTTTPRMIGL